MFIALYIITILSYNKIRGKKPEAKYSIELCFMAFAIIISCALKALVTAKLEVEGNNLLYIVSAIYGAIGGLQFEGLSYSISEVWGIMGWFMPYLYYASSIYCGLTFLTIISFKASYEIYSRIKLGLIVCFDFKKDKDIYIFTALTRDTLILADSIRQEHELKKKQKNEYIGDAQNNNYVIIFCGYELEPFDRKDDLCQEVMGNGFYYWSLNEESSLKKEKKPLIKKIGLSKYNRIHIFSFSLSEDLKADEHENERIVFGEMQNLIKAELKKIKKSVMAKTQGKDNTSNLQKKDENVEASDDKSQKNKNGEGEEKKSKDDIVKISSQELVQYIDKNEQSVFLYALARTDVDYVCYDRRICNLFANCLSEIGLCVTDENKEEKKRREWRRLNCNKIAQLKVINEADLSAVSLTRERNSRDKESDLSLLLCENMADITTKELNKTYNLLCLGFGETGQAAVKACYVDSTILYKKDDSYVGNQFEVDVFDGRIDEYSGLFLAKHPMFVHDTTKLDIEKSESFSENSEDGAREKYRKKIYGKSGNGKDISLPIIRFSSDACTSASFFSFLDKHTGTENSDGLSTHILKYATIIIALGDDVSNIAIANALAKDIRREILLSGKNDKALTQQIIAVNIRDSRNNERLNVIKEEALTIAQSEGDINIQKMLACVKIIPFGNLEKMYCYDSIISQHEEVTYNGMYDQMADRVYALKLTENSGIMNGKQMLNALDSYIKNGEKAEDANKATPTNESRLNTIAEMFNDKIKPDEPKILNSWRKLNLFKRLSNYSAKSYQSKLIRLLQYAETLKVTQEDKLWYLAQTEHERWNRFHIANGWMYSKGKNEDELEHPCLVSFCTLDQGTALYDFINVAMSYRRIKRETKQNNDKN